MDWEAHAMAADLWAGGAGALSHRSAAGNLGLLGSRSLPIEVGITDTRRSPVDWLVVHRFGDHFAAEIEVMNGLRTSSVRRTVLDLAGKKDPLTEKVLDRATRLDPTALGKMWLLYEEEWARGYRGVAILRSLLMERAPGEAPTHSDLEDLFSAIARRGSLPSPVRQFPVQLPRFEAHLDFAYPRGLIGIEVDSYAWHMDRKAFERDRERDLELSMLGWTILRFTWAKLRWEPEFVLDTLRFHLTRTGLLAS
jgi:very-short-patch-repair endonuclease